MSTSALALGTAVAGGLGVGSAIGVGLLSRRVDAIEAALVRLGVEPGEMTGIIETIQADIALLKTDVLTLTSNDSSEAQTIRTLQSQVQQLQSQINTLNTEIATLQTQVAALQSEQETLPPGLGGHRPR